MFGHFLGGILRVACRIANTGDRIHRLARWWSIGLAAALGVTLGGQGVSGPTAGAQVIEDGANPGLANPGLAKSGLAASREQTGPTPTVGASAVAMQADANSATETLAADTLTTDTLAAGGASLAMRQVDATGLASVGWNFGRSDDPQFRGVPDGWKRYEGLGYPKYVRIGIESKDANLEQQLDRLDTSLIQLWKQLKPLYPALPFPPSVTDTLVDRYLRVDLDGGQVKYESPSVTAHRIFQYQLTCQIKTEGLRHDSARAELVFLDGRQKELAVHSTVSIRGSTPWTMVSSEMVRPPIDATQMVVRLLVDRGEDGLEDIRGAVGFDDVRIVQHPQLRISTDQSLGIYQLGQLVQAKAKIMGLPKANARVQFRLYDRDDQEIAAKLADVKRETDGGRSASMSGASMSGASMSGTSTSTTATSTTATSSVSASSASTSGVSASSTAALDDTAIPTTAHADVVDSEVTWALPQLGAGYYRLEASIVGQPVETLATETTFAVIDPALGGPPHGVFGWTLPEGSQGLEQRDLALWLASMGVAWVKYPCWLAPDDTLQAEETAAVLGKLQEEGIQTVGMLDVPPEDQWQHYAIRGRRDLVAAQLFRDALTWQPLLEPVMTRLTLKVRTWQLGADRDFSFLGRPRLRESVQEIASGLQGFGQPIDVAISWPWLERELPRGESSWQAVCRSSEPPLGAKELNAYLALRDEEAGSDAPRTWLLLDPIAKRSYGRDDRIRDLLLRMATVRSHRVQAAFISDPRDPEHGLLKESGRPDELLLPWRTTSRLIGNLYHAGSLPLRSGANNLVFTGVDRAVLMVWSPEPTEEMIYLGDGAALVDVWGNVTPLREEVVGNQVVHRVPIGPLPSFLINVNPTLLAFRMSVQLSPPQLDSFLGEKQPIRISFSNPTHQSLVGQMLVRSPETWTVDSPLENWELLAGRTAHHDFDVVLSNTSKIGTYELPIQFVVETVPPQAITVYKKITVGPKGLDLDVKTKLMPNGDLRVQIEMTNHTEKSLAYDCMLFPSAQRQYQRCFLTLDPGQTVHRTISWREGADLVGTRMLLRADEKDGPRVFNHSFEVTR